MSPFPELAKLQSLWLKFFYSHANETYCYRLFISRPGFCKGKGLFMCEHRLGWVSNLHNLHTGDFVLYSRQEAAKEILQHFDPFSGGSWYSDRHQLDYKSSFCSWWCVPLSKQSNFEWQFLPSDLESNASLPAFSILSVYLLGFGDWTMVCSDQTIQIKQYFQPEAFIYIFAVGLLSLVLCCSTFFEAQYVSSSPTGPCNRWWSGKNIARWLESFKSSLRWFLQVSLCWFCLFTWCTRPAFLL